MAAFPTLTESERRLNRVIGEAETMTNEALLVAYRRADAEHTALTDQGYRGGQQLDEAYAYRVELQKRGLL